MKLKLLLFVSTVFILHSAMAQTTYTFSGRGNWTDTANWSPSYPGVITEDGDIIRINYGASLTIDSNIINNADMQILNLSTFTIPKDIVFTNISSSVISEGTITNHGVMVNDGSTYFVMVNKFINESDGKVILQNRIPGSYAGSFNLNRGNYPNTEFINKGIIIISGRAQFLLRTESILHNEITGIINITDGSDLMTQFNGGLINNKGLIKAVRGKVSAFGGEIRNAGKIEINHEYLVIFDHYLSITPAFLTNMPEGVIDYANGFLYIENYDTYNNYGTIIENTALIQQERTISQVHIIDSNTFNSTQFTDISSVPESRINGDLTISIEDPSVLRIGDTFTIPLNGLSGNFKTVNVLNNSTTFDIAYNESNFELTVTSLPQTPIVTPPAAPIVYEDASAVPLSDAIQVADPDNADQTVTFSVTGGSVTLGTTGVSFGGNGNGTDSFIVSGTLDAINTALDEATFTPLPNLAGDDVATISFSSYNGIFESNTAAVTFSIIPVNDAPYFELQRFPNLTVTQDADGQRIADFVRNVNDGDPETDQRLVFKVSNTNNALFESQPYIDSRQNTLFFTPANRSTGTATVTVLLLDDGGTANGGVDMSESRTFTITITESSRPTVKIESPLSPGPTSETVIPITFYFSEPVTGFDQTDLLLLGNFIIPNGIEGSGDTYTMDVIPTDGGLINISVPGNAAIDASGNGNLPSSQFTIEFKPGSGDPNDIYFYPNPTKDYIYFSLLYDVINITIYDLNGLEVLTRNVQGQGSLDVSSLRNGVYLIQFITGSGQVSKQKLMKE
ncbi:T9SS type A sorting domain-containing protein [Aquimarina brevivitae]|uniref:Putative secreted protein (Por secretion system target) n=1 Tax=Aquimarina brevivitae TaxID=323412 RepID=A0A4Q7P074_9FLAO|nr:T9SS type A sorting domain-containing protein [Aquimarina brevivitae]RZS93176.1 putative secreted protein (Por secretion system target) [Aquimarina brevivitae]